MALMMYFVTFATVFTISIDDSLTMPTGDGIHFDDLFTCNDYVSVIGRMETLRNDTAIARKSQEVFQDMKLNREEVLEMIGLLCQESARVATLLEEEVVRCPNSVAIENALQHPGPSCTASGDLSEFASNVIANITEINLTDICNQFIGSRFSSCHGPSPSSNMGTDFTNGLRNFESSRKEMISCMLREMDGTNPCENVDSIKRTLVMVITTSDVMIGAEFKYDDFF